ASAAGAHVAAGPPARHLSAGPAAQSAPLPLEIPHARQIQGILQDPAEAAVDLGRTPYHAVGGADVRQESFEGPPARRLMLPPQERQIVGGEVQELSSRAIFLGAEEGAADRHARRAARPQASR